MKNLLLNPRLITRLFIIMLVAAVAIGSGGCKSKKKLAEKTKANDDLQKSLGKTKTENAELQQRVLEGEAPISCRPADLLKPELDALTAELRSLAAEKSIALTPGEGEIDDVLTYALFPQIGLKFLENRGNPEAFEPPPGDEPAPVAVTEPAVN